MNNVGVFGLGILALLMAVASRTERGAPGSEERVATRLLLATVHRIENRIHGERRNVEIRVLTTGDAGCATRSPLLCSIRLDRSRLEITDYACPRLFQQVLQAKGVTAIEAVHINTEPGEATQNIVEPLEDIPPSRPPAHLPLNSAE